MGICVTIRTWHSTSAATAGSEGSARAGRRRGPRPARFFGWRYGPSIMRAPGMAGRSRARGPGLVVAAAVVNWQSCGSVPGSSSRRPLHPFGDRLLARGTHRLARAADLALYLKHSRHERDRGEEQSGLRQSRAARCTRRVTGRAGRQHVPSTPLRGQVPARPGPSVPGHLDPARDFCLWRSRSPPASFGR